MTVADGVDRPKRIQLRRTKGFRLPPGAAVVSRPTMWGNPYRLAEWSDGFTIVDQFYNEYSVAPDEDWRGVAVRHYREDLWDGRLKFGPDDVVERLSGRDLACWCPLDAPFCHADVLLEIANKERSCV